MKKTNFYKVKYHIHYSRHCKYEGAKEHSWELEEVVEETTLNKAIKFIKNRDTYKPRGKEQEQQNVVINQVIEL